MNEWDNTINRIAKKFNLSETDIWLLNLVMSVERMFEENLEQNSRPICNCKDEFCGVQLTFSAIKRLREIKARALANVN